MLEFKQSDTSAELILTLNEFVTLDSPHFLFVFTHVLTKTQVAFVLASADDESSFDRYNRFLINPSVLFADAEVGEWHYKVYEQASDSNLDPTSAGDLLEYGKLMLLKTMAYAPTKYDSTTSFKTYTG